MAFFTEILKTILKFIEPQKAQTAKAILRITMLKAQWFLMSNYTIESLVAQSCPTLWDPTDCRLPGSSIHGIFQARVLEWVAIAFSRGSSQPSDWTWVSHIVGRRFTIWATRKVDHTRVIQTETVGCQYKKYIHRSLEQNREPRNKLPNKSLIFDKEARNSQ